MNETIMIRAAAATDWPAIQELLTQARLPVEGAREHLQNFVTAWRGERLAGVAGLEVYGEAALLRSVAVAAAERNSGIGREVVRRVLDQARSGGITSVSLLTTTAGEYFPRFGFRKVDRSQLPAALHASWEFQGCCPASATAMILDMEVPGMRNADETRAAVRARYAQAAQGSGCCSPAPASAADQPACCSGVTTVEDLARTIGYSSEELAVLPEGANLGLGCGNPHAIASLKPGETVLDLGSGAGVDCFLAARQVGAAGRVIGVDMTPEMLAKARANARSGGFANVEFRLGEIEHLPVADQTVDVIISNCVINLSPEKPAVFREAFRVLKPGGRLAVSDMVASVTLPPDVQADVALYAGCIAGAATVDDLQTMLADAGFTQIRIAPREGSRELLKTWGAGTRLDEVIFSATIEAVRPR